MYYESFISFKKFKLQLIIEYTTWNKKYIKCFRNVAPFSFNQNMGRILVFKKTVLLMCLEKPIVTYLTLHI